MSVQRRRAWAGGVGVGMGWGREGRTPPPPNTPIVRLQGVCVGHDAPWPQQLLEEGQVIVGQLGKPAGISGTLR